MKRNRPTRAKPRITDLPPHLCPVCGYLLDASSNFFDPNARPRPGDYTVCGACGAPGMYDEQLRMVPMTDAEIAGMDLFNRFQVEMMRKAIRTAGPPPSDPGHDN
jgi:hypothetical protein